MTTMTSRPGEQKRQHDYGDNYLGNNLLLLVHHGRSPGRCAGGRGGAAAGRWGSRGCTTSCCSTTHPPMQFHEIIHRPFTPFVFVVLPVEHYCVLHSLATVIWTDKQCPLVQGHCGGHAAAQDYADQAQQEVFNFASCHCIVFIVYSGILEESSPSCSLWYTTCVYSCV